MQADAFSPDCGDCVCVNRTLDGWQIIMQIWDTAGQERFRSMVRPKDGYALLLSFVPNPCSTALLSSAHCLSPSSAAAAHCPLVRLPCTIVVLTLPCWCSM